MDTSNNKNILRWIIFLIIFVVISVAYWFPMNYQSDNAKNESWLTVMDQGHGYEFQYPAQLPTIYIVAIDWPPVVSTYRDSFSCTEAGSETARAGITELKIINGRQYCVTKESEGAAGSIYTNYAYSAMKGDNLVIFTFSLKSVQCGNYDQPKKAECEHERVTFDIDQLIDKMMQTLKKKL